LVLPGFRSLSGGNGSRLRQLRLLVFEVRLELSELILRVPEGDFALLADLVECWVRLEALRLLLVVRDYSLEAC
jgi:hypothetical protein